MRRRNSSKAPLDMRGPKALRSGLVSTEQVEGGDLETAELLGQGAYGLVHRVTEKQTGQSRVMKTVVRPEGWDDQRLKMEAEILENLDHPHILRIFSWYEEENAINIIMEHCEGGELLRMVREGRRRGQSFPEAWGAVAIAQCFQALVYIHAKGVVHKDLKGQNLLLLHDTENKSGFVFGLQPHIIVCDLGIAEVCNRGIFGMRGSKVAGTPATMAPEVWKGCCGLKSDVWSMGCVMFELFTNRLPFHVVGSVKDAAKQQSTWLELHKKGPNWDLMRTTPDAVILNQQLLAFKEAARPNASEVLRHSWFTSSGSNTLSPEEVDSLCKSVANWRERTPMQQALCLKMAAGCTCISMFARLFSMFDTDNSGVLERAEVVTALMSLGIGKAVAKKTAQALDINNDNSCEYLEFVAACLSSLEDQYDELLRHEFRMLDSNSRGYLSTRAMQRLMDELAPLAESHGLKLEDIDQDGDGTIDFLEFCGYFGRDGAVYTEEMLFKKNMHGEGGKSALPMKQHIRIVGEKGTLEETMNDLKRSMEVSQSMSMELPSKSQEMARALATERALAKSAGAKSGKQRLSTNSDAGVRPTYPTPSENGGPPLGSASSSASPSRQGQSPGSPPSPANRRSTAASSSPASPAISEKEASAVSPQPSTPAPTTPSPKKQPQRLAPGGPKVPERGTKANPAKEPLAEKDGKAKATPRKEPLLEKDGKDKDGKDKESPKKVAAPKGSVAPKAAGGPPKENRKKMKRVGSENSVAGSRANSSRASSDDESHTASVAASQGSRPLRPAGSRASHAGSRASSKDSMRPGNLTPNAGSAAGSRRNSKGSADGTAMEPTHSKKGSDDGAAVEPKPFPKKGWVDESRIVQKKTVPGSRGSSTCAGSSKGPGSSKDDQGSDKGSDRGSNKCSDKGSVDGVPSKPKGPGSLPPSKGRNRKGSKPSSEGSGRPLLASPMTPPFASEADSKDVTPQQTPLGSSKGDDQGDDYDEEDWAEEESIPKEQSGESHNAAAGSFVKSGEIPRPSTVDFWGIPFAVLNGSAEGESPVSMVHSSPAAEFLHKDWDESAPLFKHESNGHHTHSWDQSFERVQHANTSCACWSGPLQASSSSKTSKGRFTRKSKSPSKTESTSSQRSGKSVVISL